jgi:hypothetical protein
MTTEATVEVARELESLQSRRFQATTSGDFATLQELMAEDLTYTHTSARMETRQEFMDNIRNERLVFKGIEPSGIHIRVYGETGILTGMAVITLRGRERDTVFSVRFLDVWVRRDGRWREVAWQTTRVPEPAS